MKTLSRQNLEDILFGAAILGTGGGGDISEGRSLFDDALAKGKRFDLVSIDEPPDDALFCTAYMLGAISPVSAEEDRQYDGLPKIGKPTILSAYQRLQAHLGRACYGTICCELGGSNTAVAFYAAAMSGHVILDADPAGRAVPEVTHSTYYLAGLPAAPIVMANEFGETFIAEGVHDDRRAEQIVRALAQVSRNDIAAIDHALELKTLKPALIPGTITNAMNMGRIWREAQTSGDDVANAIAKAGGGFVAFTGHISACDWRTEAGFTLGSITIAGDEKHTTNTYRISIKNENMAAWHNGKLHATVPEMICLIDRDTHQPVTNPNYSEGQSVAVIILPAPKPFLSPRGLESFGPAYIGLDTPFKRAEPVAG